MKRSKKSLIVFGIFGLLILIQFVPVTRDNPPVTGEFDENSEVQKVFQRSCYDCHSNTTVWPWYSVVAPVSWVVADHVGEAREHLNFSTWKALPADKQAHAREEIWEEVEEGEMPMTGYLMLHSEARLSDDDKALIHQWSTEFAPPPDSADSEHDDDSDEHEGHDH
ncbi:MAG: heme-binding domain-containing protein [candidate division Zixibacteria bacterium]|nr:heme-binding domain-containing protein [candidate division Zixibacteria bacterium]MDH3936312.1 heme-binding domain-containing protein [candidate division Zixibacteria bacterium]MDH4032887.1 heme-binding domain-containing protein [candidate division Zixibacteria bacterium]